MWRTFLLVLLTFLVVDSALFAAALSWDRTEVRLQMDPDQEEIKANYRVTNEGENTIRISRVKTSCGCTGSIINRKILEPGEATEITATFNRGRRQGINRNRLQVFVDSQPEPVATLLMTVEIPTLIQAMPQIVYWTPSSNPTPRRVAITLDPKYVQRITHVEYDATQLTVSEKEDPQGRADMLLEVSPKSFEQTYRGMITIHAEGNDGRQAQSRIHAMVQPR